MDGVTSYDELMAMTPEERHQHYLDSIIRSIEDVPAQYLPALERQRQRLLAREERLRGQAS
jgi:hypothetical protein